MVAGIVDHSGLELFYTPTLRRYGILVSLTYLIGVITLFYFGEMPLICIDIGTILMVSSMGKIFIPPNSEYEQTVECPAECTVKLSPVTIINYFPHMHQTGQKVHTNSLSALSTPRPRHTRCAIGRSR